jgi:hypothetical protein
MGKLFAVVAGAIVLLTVGAILLVHRFTEPLPPGRASSGSMAAPVDRSAENPPEPYPADPAASERPMNDTGVQVPTQPPPGQGPAAIAPPTESDESEQPPPSNRRRTRVPKLDREARGKQPEE